MTTETILTDEIITELASKHLWAHAQFIGAGEVYYEGEIEFARAIEQAVLQSEQVQALRKDAERYRWLKKQFRVMSLDMGGNHAWVLQRPLREGCSIDAVCDTSMEKQK